MVAGRIAVDDRLLLSPSGLELRVRGLHAQGQPAGEAMAGQRAALNITGPRLSKELVARGDWVLHPDLHAPTQRLDVKLRLLPDAAVPRPDTHVHLHLGAAHALARITPLDADHLAAGGTAFVRLTLERGIAALAGDRVVIRDAGAASTIGGGVVVDPFGAGPRPAVAATARPACGAGRSRSRPRAGPAVGGASWVHRTCSDFARARNLPAARRQAVMAAAAAEALGPVAISAPGLARLSDAAADTLRAYHHSAPDQPGLTPDRLRLAAGYAPATGGDASLARSADRPGSAGSGRALAAPARRIG